MDRRIYRTIGYRLQAAAAWAAYGFFAMLPAGAASALGGFLGRTVGPLLPMTARARRNLARVLPELPGGAREAVVRDMWDNLGRTMAEFPHLGAIVRDAGRGGRVEIAGAEHLAAIRGDGKPCVLFGGHLANWEILPPTLRAVGLSFAQVYRAPNNPFVEAIVQRARGVGAEDLIPKGAAGARRTIEVLRAGRPIAILVDQKLNNGIAVPFFGIEAMTPSAPVQLALRFECPIVPLRVERLGGCRFRFSFMKPLAVAGTGDRNADLRAGMVRCNALLEGWIRERPGQWLWLHRRWPDS